MRFPLALAAAVFPASLFAAGTTAIGPCPPGFVQAGPSASGPVTILEGRTGGNVGCVRAPPLRAAEPAVQPTPFPTRDFRDPLPADTSVLRLVSYNPPSPTALAQQTSSRVLTRTYDLFDRVESETVPLEDGGTATIRYTYSRDGLRKTMTDAFGRVTFYEYDGQARLARVTANQGLPDQHVTEYTYWPDDLLKTIAAPNGVVTSYGYDLADRVTSIDIARDGVTLASYAYTYDANGNRLTQTETNGGAPELTTYTYDARDRLETVTYPSGTSVEYGYDPVGNRISEIERDPSGTIVSNKVAVFDAINRLSSVTDSVAPSNDATFTYDANGNLTSKTTAAGTETYDYEPRDLMVEARQGTAVVARYAYDAFGRRYLKVSSEGAFTSVVRQYLYDQTSLLHELDDADLEVAKYEYGGDRLASLVRRDEPRRFYHQDALGSVVALSDSAGAVVARYHLDAWGRYRTPSELDASANRFGFTGYLFDQETSLYYAKARFYDPEYGRFTSQDSVLGEINEPPSLHRYFYGYANPLRYVDPTGHEAFQIEMQMAGYGNKEPTWGERFLAAWPGAVAATVLEGLEGAVRLSVRVMTTAHRPGSEIDKFNSQIPELRRLGQEDLQAAQREAGFFYDSLSNLSESAPAALDAAGELGPEASARATAQATVTTLGAIEGGAALVRGGARLGALAPAEVAEVASNLRGMAGPRTLPQIEGSAGSASLAGEGALSSVNLSSATSSETALVLGVRPTIRLSRSAFSPQEIAAINKKYSVANIKIAAGEPAEVGVGVKYSSHLSRRFVRDTMEPGKPVRDVRVPKGLNVDEYVSRHVGGRQVLPNQHLMEARPNQLLGGVEQRAVRGLPDGTKLLGWNVEWVD